MTWLPTGKARSPGMRSSRRGPSDAAPRKALNLSLIRARYFRRCAGPHRRPVYAAIRAKSSRAGPETRNRLETVKQGVQIVVRGNFRDIAGGNGRVTGGNRVAQVRQLEGVFLLG